MQINRKIAHTPRSRSLMDQISALPAACAGCQSCEGICQALIDAMLLPDLILQEHRP